MMHKSLLMIAGLLSLWQVNSWLRDNTDLTSSYLLQQPSAVRSTAPLQEYLTNNAANSVWKDTTGPLSDRLFLQPPASAKPWVMWYWMHAGVSKAGITADLEAMQRAGIGGAYLACIKDTTSPSLYAPAARQLSPEWWGMVRFALEEAKRVGVKIAFHVADGFALAGGPWITPELSMQKVVWTKEYVKGGGKVEVSLSQPETNEDYYKDIAVLAYPANCIQPYSDTVLIPRVTSSIPGARAQFLAFDNGGKDGFKSDTACWIQYKYPQPFTCRSIRIRTGGNNVQAHRLLVQVSNDGEAFTTHTRLEPPRHGWQDTDEDVTHSIPAVTAMYFRFVYNKAGSEPGAEDLDAAKWKPSLKVSGIYLSDEPVVNQFESKNGSMWRVSKKTTTGQVPDSICVPLKSIVNLRDKMDASGNLNWEAPAGNWIIVRIGHTSTGHTNGTAGVGKGLECDKFNPTAISLQFDKWFGEALRVAGPELAKEVIKIFYIDSWECGSQNWSPLFAAEFKKRRGYDLSPYLLSMAGIPVESAAVSEGFLYDVRQTIAGLVVDNFYGTLNKLAHDKGMQFSAESIAPTMMSDGMQQYRNVDMPMGEFWLNSPTHDKPNDMLDAISGAHIYGKNIVPAESFTSVRMNWGEHPGMMKVVGDRNFALGANRLVLHVFTHNPWTDRKPGMTLDGVGVYFQRDQTWWNQGKAWMEYLQRCQALLQLGKPVTDVAVFTGEELPRRSVLPYRLVNSLPGIMGKERIDEERRRLGNEGTPLRQLPAGVTHSANMADPENWVDPLRGYAYDAINPDAILMATVKNKRIVLPGGASYGVLVIPGAHALNPDARYMTVAIEQKIAQLVKAGGAVVMVDAPRQSPSLQDKLEKKSLNELTGMGVKKSAPPKGKLIMGTYQQEDFTSLGLEKDVIITDQEGKQTGNIAWTHRRSKDFDIYFISNQSNTARALKVSLRVNGRQPERWDPVNGSIKDEGRWIAEADRTKVEVYLPEHGSVFLVFRKKVTYQRNTTIFMPPTVGMTLMNWQVSFDPKLGGPAQPVAFPALTSWSDNSDSTIRYYSGTAVYSTTFINKRDDAVRATVLFKDVANIATVKVNGIDCGTIWTAPYELDISKAVRPGENKIEIAVTNTWANRLIGDERLPRDKRITWTTAPFRLQGKPLIPAGLIGDIKVTIGK